MRHLALAALLALTAGAAPAVAAATDLSQLAPADQYFGRMKMSVLGIRNTLHDLELRLADHPGQADAVAWRMRLVADAVGDWERRYPHDSWLPRTHDALARLRHQVGAAEAISER